MVYSYIYGCNMEWFICEISFGTFKYSIDIFNWITSLTTLVITGVYRRVFMISQAKLTITCVLHIIINQVWWRMVYFLSTVVWYNKPDRYKNYTSNSCICKSGQPFFNPGVLIFQIYLFTIEFWIKLNIQYNICFSPVTNHSEAYDNI